jgi:hypothetical protein
MKKSFRMPSRTLDYLLMGIIAGIIAGIVLVYIVGVTYTEMIKAAESMRMAFKPY